MFLNRTLRLLALISIPYALVGLSTFLIRSLVFNSLWRTAYQLPSLRNVATATQILHSLAYSLLLTGGLGLLLHKRWSRPLLISWACFDVLASLAINILYLVDYSARLSSYAAATRPTFISPGVSDMAWSMLSSTAMHAAFPALLTLILLAPEVSHLFSSRPTGGFEVIPTASLAPTPTPTKLHT